MNRRIVITGPESTGKTNLATHLSKVFEGHYVAEYAREYISRLKSPYSYDDLLRIAMKQVSQQEESEKFTNGFVFFDTWLIITKIWFKEVYGHYPSWIDEKLSTVRMDLFLLCAPDIPWEPDPVRENGGERRIYLFNEYEKEIKKTSTDYRVITGSGEGRFQMAEKCIQNYFNIL